MANLTLSQLREAQKANSPLVNVDGEPYVVPVLYQKSPPGGTGETPPPDVSLPIQASTPVSPVPPGGGYCRIFPLEFASLLHVPADWKAANWSGNSQWCHVEGAERHADFESNLLAVENSKEIS